MRLHISQENVRLSYSSPDLGLLGSVLSDRTFAFLFVVIFVVIFVVNLGLDLDSKIVLGLIFRNFTVVISEEGSIEIGTGRGAASNMVKSYSDKA